MGGCGRRRALQSRTASIGRARVAALDAATLAGCSRAHLFGVAVYDPPLQISLFRTEASSGNLLRATAERAPSFSADLRV